VFCNKPDPENHPRDRMTTIQILKAIRMNFLSLNRSTAQVNASLETISKTFLRLILKPAAV